MEAREAMFQNSRQFLKPFCMQLSAEPCGACNSFGFSFEFSIRKILTRKASLPVMLTDFSVLEREGSTTRAPSTVTFRTFDFHDTLMRTYARKAVLKKDPMVRRSSSNSG